MNKNMKTKITLLCILVALLSSCATGPDYTPDVTAHAASWGTAPVFDNQGKMLATGNNGVRQGRSTMFHD